MEPALASQAGKVLIATSRVTAESMATSVDSCAAVRMAPFATTYQGPVPVLLGTQDLYVMSCAQLELMETSVPTSATARMEALVTLSLDAASVLRDGRVLCAQIHVLLASMAPTAANAATATMVPCVST